MKIAPNDLFRMANHAQDVDGISRAANQNMFGFWFRLVEALEHIAWPSGGNPRWEGWLSRFARASEKIADFHSPPGNDTEVGYWRRAAKSFALLTGGSYGGDWSEQARDALLEWPGGPDLDSLLNEDGSFLLTEDSDRILLEV